MKGQAYVEQCLFFQVQVTSGSGYVDFWYAPPGTWITEVLAQIDVALDAGTVEIGQDGSQASLIGNAEWTATTINQYASSKQTTAPDGLFLPAGDILRVTVGGAATLGTVRILVKFFNFDEMETQGFHNQLVTN
jgi:hypothetical protein